MRIACVRWMAILGVLGTVGCASSHKALIEQYQTVTAQRFEGAVAVVLEDRLTGVVDPDGVSATMEGFKRVKILDRKALDCGPGAPNCRLHAGFAYDDSWDEVEFIAARTITPDGLEIPIKSEEIKDALLEDWATPEIGVRVRSWQFKGVVPGAILEYRYRVRKKKITGAMFYFQGLDPVLEASFTLDTPEDWLYKFKVANLDVKPSEQKSKGRLKRTWTARQLAALIPEPGMVARDDVLASIKIGPEKISALAGPKECERITSWEDLGRCWQKHADERQFADERVKEIVEKIGKDAKTETDKFKAVWKYMNENIRYVFRGKGLEGFIPRPVAVVCSEKYGDCKAVGNLTSVLCRELGLKADPILIGPRPDFGKMETDLPFLHNFNHMIARVEADGQVYWPDATFRDASFDTTLYPNQGVDVLVLRPEKAFIDHIPVQPAEHNQMESVLTFVPDDQGQMELTLESTMTGTPALMYRSMVNSLTPERLQKVLNDMLTSAYPQASLLEQRIDGVKDNNAPIVLHMKARIPNALQSTGKGKSFEIKPLSGRSVFDHFQLTKRRYPVDLDFLLSVQSRYEVKIPNGLQLAGLPRNILGQEDEFTKLERLAQIENDRLVAQYNFSTKALQVSPEKYPAARQSFHKALDAASFVLVFEPPKKKR